MTTSILGEYTDFIKARAKRDKLEKQSRTINDLSYILEAVARFTAMRSYVAANFIM